MRAAEQEECVKVAMVSVEAVGVAVRPRNIGKATYARVRFSGFLVAFAAF
jgi:hypothetical protein